MPNQGSVVLLTALTISSKILMKSSVYINVLTALFLKGISLFFTISLIIFRIYLFCKYVDYNFTFCIWFPRIVVREWGRILFHYRPKISLGSCSPFYSMWKCFAIMMHPRNISRSNTMSGTAYQGSFQDCWNSMFTVNN